MIEVSVADTGPGVSADIRARLFDPFVTTKKSGLGIGLSVCRLIIEAHGGRLWAEDNPAGGTIFRFTIPCSPITIRSSPVPA
jgi:two-component system, LuxR family, sensor kinase FixL